MTLMQLITIKYLNRLTALVFRSIMLSLEPLGPSMTLYKGPRSGVFQFICTVRCATHWPSFFLVADRFCRVQAMKPKEVLVHKSYMSIVVIHFRSRFKGLKCSKPNQIAGHSTRSTTRNYWCLLYRRAEPIVTKVKNQNLFSLAECIKLMMQAGRR